MNSAIPVSNLPLPVRGIRIYHGNLPRFVLSAPETSRQAGHQPNLNLSHDFDVKMCVDLKITFRCGHHERHFGRCVKYYTKKSSVRNWLFGWYENTKDCGVVRRERPQVKHNCDKCAARAMRSANRRGARLNHRQYVDGEKHHSAAREPLKETGEKTPEHKDHQHHDRTSAKRRPEHHYNHKPGADTSYSQQNAPSPYVAPLRLRRPDEKPNGKSIPRNSSSKYGRNAARNQPHVDSPMNRHTITHPMPPHRPEYASKLQPPKPMYEVYLDAMRESDRVNSSHQAAKRTPPGVQEPTRNASAPTSSSSRNRWITGLHLGARPLEELSEISFACRDARDIERQVARP